ncbi:phage integrase N-terminal domain-containing protein [Methylibium petroleiphilum]|uniref:phage integrase N-terminal domain-containing protein n=1 Tax=Methylibium petroleiphilum TaxID=105560 RepID=UPI001AC28FA0|nr:phage integrase N-terminal domain-containing protein [Methylibium petroleiphilum]MBN9203742.1 integrase domain-containing protein [Methylibium petroleiphilum]
MTSASPGRLHGQDSPRRQNWAGKSPQQVLAMYPPGRTPVNRVVDVLIELFNPLHTALEKTVSHKTRYERAHFLRRFFRELHTDAGFKLAPDPRNLGQRHVQAMVKVWQRRKLSPGTIQTYLSFLRGLAMWLNKPGFIRRPEHYGLTPDEYERHENAQRDKSWSGNGIDVEALLAQVSAYDARIGASMRLMVKVGLRRKESVMCRPYAHVHPFEETGLPDEQREADRYLWTKGKGGRARWLPLATEEQQSAIAHARSVVSGHDAHMGAPDRDLKSNLRRLDYALRKFGLTKRESGTTGHGARHDHLQGQYQDTTGTPAPVRGGGPVDQDLDRQARLRVARIAGHARLRSAGAYIGAIRRSPAGSRDPAQGETGKPGPRGIGDDGDTPVPVA